MNKGPVKHILIIFALIVFQIAIGQNLVLFGLAFSFVYLLGLILLPVDTGSTLAMVVGFFAGAIIDLFYNTGGMHIAATVLVMFFRNRWLNLLTPQGGFDSNAVPSNKIGGWTWFIGYAYPLILIHHIVLFFIQSYGFDAFWYTLNKAFMSSLFTFLLSCIFLILFSRTNR